MAASRFPVESGHVLLFARSVGDTSENYSDTEFATTGFVGAAVPPTFLQCSAQFDPEFPLRPAAGRAWHGSGGAAKADNSDGRAGVGGSGARLHAEQKFDFVRPVRVGETLSAAQRPGRAWEKEGRKGGRLIFSESVTEYRDAGGELVAIATAVAVETTKAPAGDAAKSGGEERA